MQVIINLHEKTTLRAAEAFARGGKVGCGGAVAAHKGSNAQNLFREFLGACGLDFTMRNGRKNKIIITAEIEIKGKHKIISHAD